MQRAVYVYVPTLITAGLVSWLVRRWWRRVPSAPSSSKLLGVAHWVRVDHGHLLTLTVSILRSIGCDEATARAVARHLVESNLQSVDSHGVVRLEQYTEQAEKGLFDPGSTPTVRQTDLGA